MPFLLMDYVVQLVVSQDVGNFTVTSTGSFAKADMGASLTSKHGISGTLELRHAIRHARVTRITTCLRTTISAHIQATFQRRSTNGALTQLMQLGNLTTSIYVDDKPLQEYSVANESGNIITCWITSEEGKVSSSLRWHVNHCFSPL